MDPEMNFSEEASEDQNRFEVKEIVIDGDSASEEEDQVSEPVPREQAAQDGGMRLADVDADWITKQLGDDASLETAVLELIGNEQLLARDLEKRLLSIIGHKKFQLVRNLMKSRWAIFFGTLLSRAQTQSARDEVMARLSKTESAKHLMPSKGTRKQLQIDPSQWQATDAQLKQNSWLHQKLDLEKLKFEESSRLMTN